MSPSGAGGDDQGTASECLAGAVEFFFAPRQADTVYGAVFKQFDGVGCHVRLKVGSKLRTGCGGHGDKVAYIHGLEYLASHRTGQLLL